MMNLGNAYGDRTQGEPAENVEEAIQSYRQALEVMTRHTMPAEWVKTMTNLGNAYMNRIRGERAENIKEANLCHRQALEVGTPQAQDSHDQGQKP
jgi:hypothetical protein